MANNIKNGKSILYEERDDNGQLRERGNYKNGKFVGLRECWYEDGAPQERIHHDENGEWDGIYESWYKNGQPHICTNFKNGKYHGLFKLWNSNGQLKERSFYINGKEVTEDEWLKYAEEGRAQICR